MKVNIYIHLLQTSELLEIKKLLKNCLILNVAYPAAPQQMKKQWNKRTHTHTRTHVNTITCGSLICFRTMNLHQHLNGKSWSRLMRS